MFDLKPSDHLTEIPIRSRL